MGVTVEEMATLCSHVYNPKTSLFGVPIKHCTLSIQNFRDFLALCKSHDFYWCKIEDIGSHSDFHVGSRLDRYPLLERISEYSLYFGLYAKLSYGELSNMVMVIRGTDPRKVLNWITDIKSWFNSTVEDGRKDSIPLDYLAQAVGFYDKSTAYLERLCKSISMSSKGIGSRGIKFHITGHSLGGAIVKLMAAHRSYDIRPTGAVLAFNAPGISKMPDVNRDESMILHDINSRYGVINKIGGDFSLEDVCYIHVGTKRIEEEAKGISWSSIWRTDILQNVLKIRAIIEQHSINNIISSLRRESYKRLSDTCVSSNMRLSDTVSSIE